jgi:hypothetical protein
VLPALLGPSKAPAGTRVAQSAEDQVEPPARLRRVGGARR